MEKSHKWFFNGKGTSTMKGSFNMWGWDMRGACMGTTYHLAKVSGEITLRSNLLNPMWGLAYLLNGSLRPLSSNASFPPARVLSYGASLATLSHTSTHIYFISTICVTSFPPPFPINFVWKTQTEGSCSSEIMFPIQHYIFQNSWPTQESVTPRHSHAC